MKPSIRLAAVTLVCVILSAFLFSCGKIYDEKTISEKYDAEWISGKSDAEIISRYGKFDRRFILSASDRAEYIGHDTGSYYVNFYSGGIHDTYFIIFNENGIAIDSFFAKTSNGG